MPTLTIKNLPDELYWRLKKQAAMNRRSLNNELIVCIEKSVGAHRRDPASFLLSIQAVRDSLSTSPLTDELLEEAVDRGRA